MLVVLRQLCGENMDMEMLFPVVFEEGGEHYSAVFHKAVVDIAYYLDGVHASDNAYGVGTNSGVVKVLM